MEVRAKIRVKLESFNHEILVSSCEKIVHILQNISLSSIGVVTLPTRKRMYCVLRSPHVYKDSREQFEIRIHKRMLEIYYDPELPVIDVLTKIDLAPGIFYRICLS